MKTDFFIMYYVATIRRSTMPTLQQLNVVDTETQDKLSTGGAGIKCKQHPSSAAANNEIVKSLHNTKKKHWSPPKPKSSNSTTNTTISQHHWFHNQNIEYPDLRVGCDHCAQLTSAYLIDMYFDQFTLGNCNVYKLSCSSVAFKNKLAIKRKCITYTKVKYSKVLKVTFRS